MKLLISFLIAFSSISAKNQKPQDLDSLMTMSLMEDMKTIAHMENELKNLKPKSKKNKKSIPRELTLDDESSLTDNIFEGLILADRSGGCYFKRHYSRSH